MISHYLSAKKRKVDILVFIEPCDLLQGLHSNRRSDLLAMVHTNFKPFSTQIQPFTNGHIRARSLRKLSMKPRRLQCTWICDLESFYTWHSYCEGSQQQIHQDFLWRGVWAKVLSNRLQSKLPGQVTKLTYIRASRNLPNLVQMPNIPALSEVWDGNKSGELTCYDRP